jgi:hypothetical protein
MYAEVTGNSQRPVVGTVSPDFAGYFKEAFRQIDELFMQEVADVKSR